MSRLEDIINAVTANQMREITVERAKQIAIEYARECAAASLEKASKNIPKHGKTRDALKPIITNLENIVLL